MSEEFMKLTRRGANGSARVLKLIRAYDSSGVTYSHLLDQLGISPRHFTAKRVVDGPLVRLEAAGLIEFGEEETDDGGNTLFRVISFDTWLDVRRRQNDPRFSDPRFRVTPLLQRVQSALYISLTELADADPYESVTVKPFFGGQPLEQGKKFDIFVAMPFRPDLNPVYQDHIKRAAEHAGLTVKRGDDFFTAREIMKDIWAALWACRIVVADCTGRNPNVFYEIGLAHTIGKTVVLITQNSDDVPFDLRHLRYIKYDFTPRGMTDFEETLKRTLPAELVDAS